MLNCSYGVYKKVGVRSWIQCLKSNQICPFQRYCINERKVVHTQESQKCKLRNDEK